MLRAVVQRVAQAHVEIEGTVTASIGRGIVVLLGVGRADDENDAVYLASKVANLRIFEDEEGKLNRSVTDVGGEALVVSNFTLYGDCRKGRRPSFVEAGEPEVANRLYEHFIAALQAENLPVQKGIFQAKMLVRIDNEGPVTLLLDSKKEF